MGGRGAASGMSSKGNPYSSQFHAVADANGKPLVSGNIKFVEANSRTSESLFETMTAGRVYAVAGGNDLLKIIYFDKNGRRVKQIDLNHPHKGIEPHTHHGYNHNENDSVKGAAHLIPAEKRMVERVRGVWYDYISKKQ